MTSLVSTGSLNRPSPSAAARLLTIAASTRSSVGAAAASFFLGARSFAAR